MRRYDININCGINRFGKYENHRPCPVCHGSGNDYLTTLNFALPDGSPLPSEYDLIVCQRCGTGYADSASTQNDYATYYRFFSKYEDIFVASGGGEDPADKRRLEDVSDYLGAKILPGARILDVGCGNGGLLAAFKRLGFTDLTGFDPSAACCSRIENQGFSAYNVSLPLEDRELPSKYRKPYDLIILSHVLEHVYDAYAVVASLVPFLAANGVLYIETPDPSRYLTTEFPPFYFFDPEHINHFSEESFSVLGASFGLAPLEIGHKDLVLANGSRYPAFFVLMKSINSAVAVVPQLPRVEIFSLLQTYVAQGLRDLEPLRARILSLVGQGRPFALWGAGSLSQRLLGLPWFPRELLRAVVDRDTKKHGLRFAGCLISSPEVGLQDLPSDAVVLCAAAIASQAIEQDYRNLRLPYPFYSLLG